MGDADEHLATGTDEAATQTDVLGAELGATERTPMAPMDPNGLIDRRKWPRRDSNSDDQLRSADFKSAASANSATGPWARMSLSTVLAAITAHPDR